MVSLVADEPGQDELREDGSQRSDLLRSEAPHDEQGGADRIAPFNAILLLSYGGPEGPDDVVPFLQNVTRGKGIPEERLREVGGHYFLFGGKSPINDQNRELLAALKQELADRRLDIPVYWGNRNWAPYLTDTLREIHRDGHRSIVVIVTSAYSSYSSCRQYREDLVAAQQQLADEGKQLEIAKIRQYYNHPGFADASVGAALDGIREAAGHGENIRLLFVTHSIPDAMNETSGPEGQTYFDQHRDLAQYVVDRVKQETGVEYPWELVFCSRSGPPSQPWLEPDINDTLAGLEGRVDAVVAVPIGFISDHMEVKFDLDTEAKATAAEKGIPFVRARTASLDPGFVTGLIDLVQERAAQARGESPEQPVVGSLPPATISYPPEFCKNLKGYVPALGDRETASLGR